MPMTPADASPETGEWTYSLSGLAIPSSAPGAADAPGHPQWGYSPAGLLIPARPAGKQRYDRPVGIGLFSGAGGLDLGLHQAGFHMAAAAELDPAAALTYMVNLARQGVKIHFDTAEREENFAKIAARHLGLDQKPGKTAGLAKGARRAGDGWISTRPPSEPACEHFWIADVRNLTGKQILDELGLKPGDVDVVAGGPPCQGYSSAGRRNVMDPRNSLVFEFARLVLEIRPRTFVMENVPGMLSMVTPEGVPVVDALCLVLEKGGFSTFDALKSALAAQAGSAGLLRRNQKTKNDPKPAQTDTQLDLFGEA